MEASAQSLSWISRAASSLLLVVAAAIVGKVFAAIWWKPLRIKRALEAQGIRGPPYRIFYGNMPEIFDMYKKARSLPMPEISHNIVPRILPPLYKWSKMYGVPHLFWNGYRPNLLVTDPEIFKEILSHKFGHYKKSGNRPDTEDLLGNGLVRIGGEKWARHRRILNPAFFMEKLKAMVPTVAKCATLMLDGWETQIDEEESKRKEIDVHDEFKTLTADIIAHTAFGSSYAEGKQVFEMQSEQQKLMENALRTVYIPGSRFLPTASRRYRWRLIKQIRTSLGSIIQGRMDRITVGRGDHFNEKDLLGLMIEANKKEERDNKNHQSMSIQDMIDECKTFFFAGHETTSNLLAWTMLLLAIHPEWQERARAEVLAVCGKEAPNADSVNHLKIVGMVLNEALRLYPPAVAMFRRTCKEMKVGEIWVPEGVEVVLPILMVHHDPEYWGEDAGQFNPQRFEEGVLKACKHPMAFMPFSTGPRVCIGQNFALLEARIVVAMLLQRPFSFRVSPAYKHAPTTVLTMQPQSGMQIIVEKIQG